MNEERRSFLLDCYAKEWDPEFLEHRDFKEDDSYLKWKEKGLIACGDPIRIDGEDPQVDGEGLRIFLRDYDDGGPLYGAEDVEEFCEDKQLQDILSGEAFEYLKRNVWIDDRSRSGEYREYQNPMTPYTLFRALDESRFDNNNEKPDADQRRMLFVDLEPYHILVLAETASELQVPVLRDAIQKHLALETSLRVHIPLKGISMFHLELHLPYFALRQSTRPTSSHLGNKRQCIDLSFLTTRSNGRPSQLRYKIFDAQISFVISGWEDSRWVAWSFIDNYFSEEELLDIDGYPYKGFVEDPIAKGQLDQNKPLVNPREYFLMILKVRSEQVLQEWEWVVQTVKRNVKRYVRMFSFHPFALTLTVTVERRATSGEAARVYITKGRTNPRDV
jgi:hypothetical protein